MPLSLADLWTAKSQDDVTQAFADIATALGYDYRAWASGRVGRVLMSIFSKIYSGFTQVTVAGPVKGGFRETATGQWLTLWVKSMLDVDKNTETYATGSVTLTNAAAVPYTFSPGGLLFTNASTGSTYVNTYDATIYGALPGLATLPAPVTKTISGASNASPIVITTTTPHGFVNNEQIVIAGVLGNTNANGTWVITVVTTTTFSLNGSTGNAAYTGGPGTASSGVLTIPVQATLPGSASSATTAGVVTTLNPSLLGVTCTNALPFLATDDETDDELRTRADAKMGALSPNGHETAYIFMALSVRRAATDPSTSHTPVIPPPQGDATAYAAAVSLPVVRCKVVRSGINVTTYVANANAGAGVDDVALIDNAIQQNVVPVGINETTLSATTVTVNIAYTAELDPAYGVSDLDAQNAIATALAAWFADVRKNPIGAKSKVALGTHYIYLNVLEGVIIGALPAAGLPPAIITADITSPGADVVITASQLAVLGSITPTITDVPQ